MSKGFTSIPPNPTIYVNNLNEKLKKEELKRNLYLLFCQYGNVLEIHCSKTKTMRGQAWIIFDALSGATRCLRDLQGFKFFGKDMRVSYAKSKSDVTAKMEGTFTKNRAKRKAANGGTVTSAPVTTIPAAKKAKEGSGANRAKEASTEEEEPNNILFAENLPTEDCDEMMLGVLFSQYSGFKEARMVAGKPGIAFVEFTDTSQAGVAKESLQNFLIKPEMPMKLTFARQ